MTVPEAARAPRYCAIQYTGSLFHGKSRARVRAIVTAGFKWPPDILDEMRVPRQHPKAHPQLTVKYSDFLPVLK